MTLSVARILFNDETLRLRFIIEVVVFKEESFFKSSPYAKLSVKSSLKILIDDFAPLLA